MTSVLPICRQQVDPTSSLSGQPVEISPEVFRVDDLVAGPRRSDDMCEEGGEAAKNIGPKAGGGSGKTHMCGMDSLRRATRDMARTQIWKQMKTMSSRFVLSTLYGISKVILFTLNAGGHTSPEASSTTSSMFAKASYRRRPLVRLTLSQCHAIVAP